MKAFRYLVAALLAIGIVLGIGLFVPTTAVAWLLLRPAQIKQWLFHPALRLQAAQDLQTAFAGGPQTKHGGALGAAMGRAMTAGLMQAYQSGPAHAAADQVLRAYADFALGRIERLAFSVDLQPLNREISRSVSAEFQKLIASRPACTLQWADIERARNFECIAPPVRLVLSLGIPAQLIPLPANVTESTLGLSPPVQESMRRFFNYVRRLPPALLGCVLLLLFCQYAAVPDDSGRLTACGWTMVVAGAVSALCILAGWFLLHQALTFGSPGALAMPRVVAVGLRIVAGDAARTAWIISILPVAAGLGFILLARRNRVS